MPQPTKLIGIVERALDIIELFNEWTPELGLSEIAEATRLHKSTAASLIHSLAVKGYLDPNPANRKYRLGPKIISRTKVALNSTDLRQTATPYLHRLRDCFNETVNLAIADASDMVYVERPLCAHALGLRSEGGKRERAHSIALGKSYACLLETHRPTDLCGPLRAALHHCTYDHRLGHLAATPGDHPGDLC
jgi:IclR family transcriptional regulator, KDG regulon repressor